WVVDPRRVAEVADVEIASGRGRPARRDDAGGGRPGRPGGRRRPAAAAPAAGGQAGRDDRGGEGRCRAPKATMAHVTPPKDARHRFSTLSNVYCRKTVVYKSLRVTASHTLFKPLAP